MITRRSLLRGMFAAPAIITVNHLMPIKTMDMLTSLPDIAPHHAALLELIDRAAAQFRAEASKALESAKVFGSAAVVVSLNPPLSARAIPHELFYNALAARAKEPRGPVSL